MEHLDALLERSADPEAFSTAYFNYLAALMRRIDPAQVGRLIRALEAARASGATVFIAGNGGSAATASHMATDLAMGTRSGAPEVPLRILALTDNTAFLTALGNDEGYSEVFVSQLRSLYRPGDLLVAISASGNSPNILEAARWVKGRRGLVLGLIGFDGGALKGLCDVAVHVPTPKGEYGPVEDLHLVINHLTRVWMQRRGAPVVLGADARKGASRERAAARRRTASTRRPHVAAA